MIHRLITRGLLAAGVALAATATAVASVAQTAGTGRASHKTRRFVRVARVMALTVAVLLGITAFDFTAAQAAPTGSAARSVLVILVDWPGGGGTPAAPADSVTPSLAEDQISGTDSYWYQAVSYGQFAGWNATATGWYQIATPPLDAWPTPSCSNSFRANIQAEGNSAAEAAGFNIASYAVVMYYFSYVPCGWGGWTIGYNAVWIDGSMDTAATVHELGHTLGLGHGHALSCLGASGQPVALSSNCTSSEYGDGYDVMGCCESGSFSAMQKFDLGWMSGREEDVPPAGGTFTLEPLEAITPGLQALRVTDGSQILWLEYRRPVGVDSWLSPSSADGILIHEQLPDAYTSLGSNLLDMTPGSAGGFSDAALPVGTTWADPLGTDVITVNSAGPTGAQVTIASRNPIVPDVVGDSAADALTALHGFAVTEHFIVDNTCNNINYVISQNPPGGTVATAGSAVSIWVGKRGPYPCP